MYGLDKHIINDASKLGFKVWNYKYRLQLKGFNAFQLYAEIVKPKPKKKYSKKK